MRRTVGLGVVAVTLVALAGVAGTQTVGRSDPGAPSRGAPSYDARAAAVTSAMGGALDTSAPAGGVGDATRAADGAVPAGGVGETGRRRIGTVLRLTRLLGGGSGERSTTLRYPGAPYVKVHLNKAVLRDGGTVTVSDPERTEVHRYDARSLAGGRWAMSVTGDTAVVTVNRGTVEVDRVARGYSRVERQASVASEPGVTGRKESVCGRDDKSDAVCYRSSDPVVYRRSKAVVRLLINGSELCTGWRIGPKNRFLTNNHCFADSRAAYNTEVWFNYQCATCGGWKVFQPTKVWGHRVLTTDRVLDVTVFTVSGFQNVERFGYLKLELAQPSAGEEVFIPQHPGGDPTMIATRSDEDRSGTCAIANPADDGYAPGSDVSYYCDTEGGSSGSPVLSRRTGRVVALHHFGGCPNSGVRADLIHQRIRHLL